jgi:hypothetical protein
MAELDPHSPATGEDSKTETPCSAGTQPHRNGAADGKPADGAAQPGECHTDRSGFARAEEIVDNLAEKAASVTAASGRKVLWFMSRAREVAEDFWADVQDFRNGKQP